MVTLANYPRKESVDLLKGEKSLRRVEYSSFVPILYNMSSGDSANEW
jgi:hypothetical protein